MAYTLSKTELIEQFEDQLRFIDTSCQLFDSGNQKEARRIAVALRVLFHDTDKSHSLSKQLNIKRRMIFQSLASDYSPTNMLTSWQLLSIKMSADTVGAHSGYVPKCVSEEPGRIFLLAFDDWWNQIIFDDKEYQLSRRDIVLSVANTDGGAHVDSQLKTKFANLVKENSLGILMMNGAPIEANPAYAAIRTIADEVQSSLALMHKTISKFQVYYGHDFQFYFSDNNQHTRFLWSLTDRRTTDEIRTILSTLTSTERIDVGVVFGSDEKAREVIVSNIQNLKLGQSVLHSIE